MAAKILRGMCLGIAGTTVLILFTIPLIIFYIYEYTDINNSASVDKPLKTFCDGNSTFHHNKTTSCTLQWSEHQYSMDPDQAYSECMSNEYQKICEDILLEWTQCTQERNLNCTLIPIMAPYVANSSSDINEVFEAMSNFSDCKMQAVPFLCQYYYPLIDSTSEKIYTASKEECTRIVTTVCRNVPWSSDSVPNCKLLEGIYTTNSTDTNETLQCSDEFFEFEGLCVPHCEQFHMSPYPYTVFVNVCQSIAGITCICTMIIIGVYSIKERKKIIRFPSVFSLFLLFNLGVSGMNNLLANFLGPKLFCNSDNLLETQSADPTIACVFTGVVRHYSSMGSTIWWILFMSILVFRVTFPFKARRLKTHKYRTRVYWILTIGGFLIPLPAVLVSLTTDGNHYRIVGFPPRTCSPPELMQFYSVVLPINILLAIGICFVCYVVWMFNRLRGNEIRGKIFAPAEKKFLILLVLYLLSGVYAMIYSVIVMANADKLSTELTNYFQCEATGYSPGKCCSRDAFQLWANSYSILSGILNLLFAMIPPAFIISFLFNWQTCCFKNFKRGKESKTLELNEGQS